MSYSRADFVADVGQAAWRHNVPNVHSALLESEGNELRALASHICAVLAKAQPKPESPLVSRWKCPDCGSHNVEVSLPTWYIETKQLDLKFVETDTEATITWWYCGSCEHSGDGAPTLIS